MITIWGTYGNCICPNRGQHSEPESSWNRTGIIWYYALLSPVEQLPPDLHLIVSREISANELNMERLLETFEKELVAQERAFNAAPLAWESPFYQQPITSALVSNTSSSMVCVYCEQSHLSLTCSTVPSIEACKKILRNSGCCFNCLRKNHLSRNCRSTSNASNAMEGITPLFTRVSDNLNPQATPFQPELKTPTLVCEG